MDILLREAVDQDAKAITELFREVYSDDYPYQNYYDETELKRLILSENTVMVVAENKSSHELYGTASIILQSGAYSDLAGEFGRLVVSPSARNQGIGKKLMQARLDLVEDRLHVAIVEPRLNNEFSSKISNRFGFSVVGYQPCKYQFSERENLGLMARFLDRR